MNMLKILPILLFSLLSTAQVWAKKQAEQVNYIELASLMLKDGNLDRAQIALSQVDSNDESIDLQRFYIISALLNIRTNNNQNAIDFIQKAKDIGPVDAVINVYLAQAAYAVEDFQLALDALDAAAESVAKIPSIYHMRAQSHWNLGQSEHSIAILDQAMKIFPDDKTFPRRKIFFYLELGLNKQAVLLGQDYLTQFKGELADYVAIGNAIRASGDHTSALQFLEQARLKFPYDEDIAKTLASVYIMQENFSAAAKIIHDVAIFNPDLIQEAAELYRRSGEFYLALNLNASIQNQTEKVKQRLAIFLQLENFEGAAGMEDTIKRLQLDSDENIQYALAYAFFKIGKYSTSEKYLSQIKSTENFTKAIELRKIIQECEEEIWRCQ